MGSLFAEWARFLRLPPNRTELSERIQQGPKKNRESAFSEQKRTHSAKPRRMNSKGPFFQPNGFSFCRMGSVWQLNVSCRMHSLFLRLHSTVIRRMGSLFCRMGSLFCRMHSLAYQKMLRRMHSNETERQNSVAIAE